MAQASYITIMTYKKQTNWAFVKIKSKMSQHIRPENRELDRKKSGPSGCLITYLLCDHSDWCSKFPAD